MFRRAACVLVSPLALWAQTAGPAKDAAPLTQPALSVTPAQPAPGGIARLTLRVPVGDSIASVRGTMAGEPLHFVRIAEGAWHAIGGVPVDAARSVVVRAEVQRGDGTTESVRLAIAVPPPPKRRTEPLAVDSVLTRPDPERDARIARENARARAVGQHAHDTPALWTESFLKPRSSVITSMFGSGRVFNGAVTSRHLGVDFRGKVGEPIRAANRGVVALVDSFVLAGNVIYIDHGAGVVTGYFHMSKTLVSVGDTVSRGQVIGEVGQSGRVTGPHLHWNARYGAVTVNPLDLVTIPSSWYPAGTQARAAPR
jgi:murein DD-endopeptidase MepM/ murein hydrolase activator NlpD